MTNSLGLADWELEEMFDEMLDECHTPYMIADMTYTASEILKNCDPIAYRVGLADFESILLEEKEAQEANV
jgi:hypothetical protein